MGVFSFIKKDKQAGESAEPPFRARDDDAGGGRGRPKERKSRAATAPADDPLLPEKKRARRRLLGAIALVIAVVIGLPMALDPEPKPLADDIAIQIPARDKPAPARTSASSPAQPTVAASLDQKEEIVVPDKPPTKVAAAAAAAPQEEVVEPAPASPAKPVAKAVVAPQPAHAPAVDEAARAKAILEGKADVKPASDKASSEAKTEAASGKVVLQVAALATQEKINEVQSKLKSVGIISYTQKISTESGPRTRIRVLAANPEEADRLRAKMAKVSLNAQTVASGH